MNDRELLEAAAKAANLTGEWQMDGDEPLLFTSENNGSYWHPLTDDGDALRLAVKLRISVVFFSKEVAAMLPGHGRSWAEFYGDDPDAAVRRAIVRAAAALA